jgi:pseudouridine kinase
LQEGGEEGKSRKTSSGLIRHPMPPPIICIGGALIDRKHRLKAAAVHGSSNPSVAVATFGGVARNVAEVLARLGADARLAAAVGDDAGGRDLLAHAQAAGIDVSACTVMTGEATAEYLAILAPETGSLVIGSSSMDGAERHMERHVDDLLEALPADCLLFADANLTGATLETLARHARSAGLPLVLDAVSVAKAKRLPADLGGAALVVMNADEAAACLGLAGEPAALAHHLHRRGAGAAIVTAGEKGAAIADAAGVTHLPATPATVVDVTGAGDSLTATVLWRMSLGETPRQALPFGLAAAAATVSTAASVHHALSPGFLQAAVSRIASA